MSDSSEEDSSGSSCGGGPVASKGSADLSSRVDKEGVGDGVSGEVGVGDVGGE